MWGLTRYAYTIRATGDLERALEMIEEAQKFSLELNSRHLQILSLLIFGQCLENIGQYSSAFEKYDMALDLSMEISARPFQSLLFNRIGLAMGGSGDFDAAYDYFEKSLNTAQEIGADWLKIGPLGNLAYYKRSKGNFKSAIDDLERVRRFSEKFGDKKDTFNAYLALADLYKEMGEKEKSQEYYWKGLLLGINLGFFQIQGIVDLSDED